MPKLQEVKGQISAALTAVGIEASEAARETELIVEHVTGLTLAQQVLKAKDPLEDDQLRVLMSILRRREKRVPLQYCLGYAHFMGLKLTVRPGVLIPRTDTETLVEVALSRLTNIACPKAADIGSGTGAIAIALLKAHPGAHVTAIDIAADAIALTRENALYHQVFDRLTIIHRQWTLALPACLDAILSNPPYIPRSQRESLPPEIAQYEPEEALFGEDEDGLGFYRRLAAIGPEHLRSGGFVALELGDRQATAATDIFAERGWQQIEVHKDLNGLPRVLSAVKPNA